jgi:hypothetical protein
VYSGLRRFSISLFKSQVMVRPKLGARLRWAIALVTWDAFSGAGELLHRGREWVESGGPREGAQWAVKAVAQW